MISTPRQASPSYIIPNVPHLTQPDDYSCSEMAALILHDYHGIDDFVGNDFGGVPEYGGLRNFVAQCSQKIGVHNSDTDIHFENMLPCMSPKLNCRVEHLRSIDELKQRLAKGNPIIVRYKQRYRHSVVARGYTPEHIVINDPASPYPSTAIPQTKLDALWRNAQDLSSRGRPVMTCTPTKP